MALSKRECYHRWSSLGRCVSPGCFATRPSEEISGRRAPFTLDIELRGEVIPLLSTHNNEAIARQIGIDRRTVAKIRREEAPG